MRRRNIPGGLLQRQIEVGVFHQQTGLTLPGPVGIKLRVKSRIKADFVVEELLITEHWRVRPNGAQEQRFTPTGMGTDQIGGEALRLELIRCLGTGLAANHLGFRLQNQRMNARSVPPFRAITEVLKLIWKRTIPIESIDSKGHQLMASDPRQTLNDMEILARKVLVNKQKSHRSSVQMR